MNYPEELRERYNEVMFDERDIIEKFLKDQYDIRYGRQRDTWHFEPAVEVIARNGSIVQIHDIKLDRDKFVVFYVEAFCEKNVEWECTDFAYGELSKVIDVLPNATDLAREMANSDLLKFARDYNTEVVLSKSPYSWTDNKSTFVVESTFLDKDGHLLFEVHEYIDGHDEGVGLWDNIEDRHAIALGKHVRKTVLRNTHEYKRLRKYLEMQTDCRYQPKCLHIPLNIEDSDLTVDFVKAELKDDELHIVVQDEDETIEINEDMITTEYIVTILEYAVYNIIDIYNGHDRDMVAQINDAWKSHKYVESFGYILLALLIRDKKEFEDRYDTDAVLTTEYAYDHAHEIMEGVCDDWDLECILCFIRYDKPESE